MDPRQYLIAQAMAANMEDGAGPMRTHSGASNISRERMRPRSRGSTTSLQSVGVGNAFQPNQQHQDNVSPLDQQGYYMQNAPNQTNEMYGQPSPGQMIMQYQQQMAQMPQQGLEQPGNMPPQHDMRPMSQHGFQDMQPYPMGYPHGMPQYPVGPQHMHQHIRHQSEQFEGSPAPEDSNNENGGAKRRKGTASSLANDQELRRLLQQYQGKSLKEVANEVQKNEGSGGKSEKAKQVFAMLWLRESCVRSTNSVRRDRVFARYTERCGNERVPTLNPASFGKLVRIIFPNVQTRRLGVRGESKYHYVDLSLFPDDDDQRVPFAMAPERPGTASGLPDDRRTAPAELNRSLPPQIRAASISHPPTRTAMDTADFPSPSTAFQPRNEEISIPTPKPNLPPKMDCQYVNTATIRIPTGHMSTSLISALPSIRPNLPATMSTYLAMPSSNSLSNPAPSGQESIDLPDIHPYLAGTTYDPHIAKLLHDLYRSYCIDVVDAFRKCKEKPFFNHHSAFNGKMTVPVSKLFTLECLAPWIQECDMRMYKQLARFVAPLALQNVPDLVWGVFDRISAKLVSHVVGAFEEKVPMHVVVAKVVPAARFANLLKKLKSTNGAVLQMARMLEDPQSRTQMWLDLMVMIDPDKVLDESMPPPESLGTVQAMLRHDLRVLIAPMDDALVNAAEEDPTSAYANFMLEPSLTSAGVLPNDFLHQSPSLLDRWIQWLERLPQAFDRHHSQCMVDWHTRFWRSIMMQVGSGGAHSYQSWWSVEAFATQVIGWMTVMEGLLMSEEEQKTADAREMEKKGQELIVLQSMQENLKRKRSGTDVGGQERLSLSQPPQLRPDTKPHSSATDNNLQAVRLEQENLPSHEADGDDTDAELDELRRGGPLDLPTIHTGLTSPMKAPEHQHDDSGIDLGLDIDVDNKEVKKFNQRDWFLSSDPVEQGTGLGVTA